MTSSWQAGPFRPGSAVWPLSPPTWARRRSSAWGLGGEVRHHHQPVLLDRCHSRHGLCGHLYDAVLLRIEGAIRARVPAHALRREDPRDQRGLLRHHDRLLVRHLHVCHGAADPDAGAVSRHHPGCLHLSCFDRAFGSYRAGLHLPRRAYQRHLQRGAAVLPDRRGISAAGLHRPAQRRRMAGHRADPAGQHGALVARHGPRQHQSSGGGVVWPGDGAWLRAVVRLLVHGLPGDPARHGGGLAGISPARSADRRDPEDVFSVPCHPAGADRRQRYLARDGEVGSLAGGERFGRVSRARVKRYRLHPAVRDGLRPPDPRRAPARPDPAEGGPAQRQGRLRQPWAAGLQLRPGHPHDAASLSFPPASWAWG